MTNSVLDVIMQTHDDITEHFRENLKEYGPWFVWVVWVGVFLLFNSDTVTVWDKIPYFDTISFVVIIYCGVSIIRAQMLNKEGRPSLKKVSEPESEPKKKEE